MVADMQGISLEYGADKIVRTIMILHVSDDENDLDH